VAIPVVRAGRVAGLVTQHMMFEHLGHRYGFSLWNERPVSTFVETSGDGFDRLPASASLEQATELVRRRPAVRRFDPVVIETENGGYHGLLTVDLLLAEMTRLKVDYALQANPLTGLPGSLALARASETRLGAGRHFALAWLDLDHFKSYNDRYGFRRGDEVLLLFARILRAHLDGLGDALLAHPGGDDFVYVAPLARAEEIARQVAHEFEAAVAALYDPEDRALGGIVNLDRRGEPQRFGFVTVSVGVVAWSGEPGVDYRRLVEIAAEVKAKAKSIDGSAVVVNTRALVPKASHLERHVPDAASAESAQPPDGLGLNVRAPEPPEPPSRAPAG
jgi:diguanylate cyclase (GGDEF)-like protein